MQLKEVRTNEDKTVTLEVVVEAAEFEDAIQQVFKQRGKTITVPGFRKGKATRKMIEKVYGEGVFYEDAMDISISKAYPEALKEGNVEPVDRPNVEVPELPTKEGFTFTATVDVKPVLTLGQYKELAVDKITAPVTDEQVMTQVKKFQDEMSRQVTVEDRAAQLGDTAVIDFEGFLEDVPFPGGKGEQHSLELGSGSFIPGFEDQIVGKNPGDEFDVNVTFPAEYHAEELAGKAVVFQCKLHEITSKELPELDDEFAKDVSEFDTLEDWKKDIRTKLEKEHTEQAQGKLENDLLEKVCENMEGHIPACLFEQRAEELIQEFAMRLQSQGLNVQDYMRYTGMDAQTLKASYLPGATAQVKTRLALEEIVKAEGIAATAEEIEAEYGKLAEEYHMDVEKIKERVDTETLGHNLSMGKALDLVRDSAVVTEKAAGQAEEAAAE